MTRKDYEKAILAEIERWPEATVEFVEGGKHPKAKLSHGGKMLSVPYSGTPGTGGGVHAMLGDVRRALRKLGAERDKPDPSKDEDEAPYRKPNDGKARRPSPVRVEAANVKPDVSDQLVEAGVATPEQAKRSRGERVAAIVSGDDEVEESDAEEKRKAAFEARVAGIVDGVYFGLPADVYHAVERLSSSGTQKLDVSPADFWKGSWFDPERPEPDEDMTIAQTLGRAYHTARLEPHLFEGLYVRELVKEEMPKGSLITGPQLDKALDKLGLKKTGTVLEKAERLADDGYPESMLWHVQLERWRAERGERTALPARHYDQMITDRDRIGKNTQIGPLLNGGEAEVSVFWTDEHGVKMKARLDYLHREWWVDFKTFDNPRGRDVDQCLADAVRYNRLYMQAVVYREAVEAIRLGGLEVVEAQTDDQRSLVAALRIRPTELAMWFVFQQKGGVPNLLAYEFPFYIVPFSTIWNEQITDDEQRRAAVREMTSRRSQIHMKGHHDVLKAKKLFVLYSQVYDRGEPWFPIEAIRKFTDEDFHPYWLEGAMR